MSEEDKDELVHIEVGEEELFADICRVVSDYRRQMEASQSLTYTKPEKAANALYRWSTGWSPTKIRKKLGVQPVSLRNMLVDFAIHADKWQELGAKISSRSWVRMGMLEDEVLEKLVRRQPPPHHRGRPVKVKYATEVSVRPPNFTS